MPDNQRTDWIDFAKGIGIILVVYGHVQQGLQLSDVSVYYYIEKIIYSFHMQLFFFLSGFFVERSLSNGFRNMFMDKLRVIIYPFLLWSLLHGVTQIIMSSHTNQNLTFHDLLLSPYKPIAHFWFLQALFFAYIVYALFRKIDSVGLIVILSGVMYASRFYFEVGILNNLFRMFIFFVGGSLFHGIYHKGLSNNATIQLMTAVLVFIFFHIIAFYYGIGSLPVVRFIGACIGITFVVSLSFYCSNFEKVYNIIKYIGFLSMPIYLAHTIGSAGTRIILSKIFHIQTVSLYLFLGTIAGLIFPILLYILMKKVGFSYLFSLKKDSALSRSITKDAIQVSESAL